MAFNKERVQRDLQRFQAIVNRLPEEDPGKYAQAQAQLKRHVFWVMNRDNRNAAPHAVTGDVLEGMILDDQYDFESLGLNGSQAVKDKIARKAEQEQAPKIEAGRQAKKLRQGIVDETPVEAAPIEEAPPPPEPPKPPKPLKPAA